MLEILNTADKILDILEINWQKTKDQTHTESLIQNSRNNSVVIAESLTYGNQLRVPEICKPEIKWQIAKRKN